MLFDPPNLFGFESFQSKFVRVGNEIHVTEHDDLSTLHKDLAEKDKILQRVTDLKQQNPEDVDGGILFISGRTIQVGSASSSLSIPTIQKARDLTIQKLKKKRPDYNIKKINDV